MTYKELELTGTNNTLGEMFSVASANGTLFLWANPGQDIWQISLASLTATELQSAFGPQTATWVIKNNDGTAWIYQNLPRTSGGRFRGSGTRIDRWNINANGGIDAKIQTGFTSGVGATEEDLREAQAAASDGTNAWLFTTTKFYTVADVTATLVGDHNLTDVKGAAYWHSAQRIIVIANNKLLFFDPVTMETEDVVSEAPADIRSLTVHNRRLYGVTANRLIRFDTPTVRTAIIQRDIEERRFEVRFRQRKTNEIMQVIPPDVIEEAEFNWDMTRCGHGRMRVAAELIDFDVLQEAAKPSAAIGGVNVEYYGVHPQGEDTYLGSVSSINFMRGASTNVSIVNVGNVGNSIWVLGKEGTGLGGAECRRIVEVGDEFLIAARGIHQMNPKDERGSTDPAELQNIGNAELNFERRKLIVDERVDFTRSQRIDRVDFYLRDPLYYFEKRFSDPGQEEVSRYGGSNAGEFISNMVNQELATTPAGFDPARHRNLTLTNDLGGNWEWIRRSVGSPFYNSYTRTRLSRILEQALLGGGLSFYYEVDPDTNKLYLSVKRIVDKTMGDNRVVLTDAGESINPDAVDPGDRVEREFVVGNRALSTAVGGSISATELTSLCGDTGTRQLTAEDLSQGVTIQTIRVIIDHKGIRKEIGTDPTYLSREEQRLDILDLSLTARTS